MNVFIFAIGGTGARVLRSLTFCLASGIEKIPDGTNIIPLIIDYDKDNGDKRRTIELLDTYTAIRDKAYQGVTRNAGDRNFFHPVIRHLSDVDTIAGKADVVVKPSYEFTFGLDDKTKAGTFADYIDYTNMMGDTYLTKDLLASLYNNEPEDFPEGSHPFTELNLELSMGFKGNPNIGSIVFENLKDDKEFKRFCNTFDATHDRVFIISSIFGGTGSSGFPRIVDAIHYSGIAGFDRAMVGASIVMPYFKVNTPQGGAINSNIFNSKQKAALSYYAQHDQNGKNIYDKLTTAYFIGDDEPTVLPYSEGRDTQKNDAHIVEFLSALSVLDFICKDRETLAASKYREYGLPKNVENGEKFNFTNFDENDYEDYLQFLFTMGLTFKYYKDYVANDTIPEKEAYYKTLDIANKVGRGMYKNLESFIDDFNCWLDEMTCQKDGFKPFLHKPRKDDSQTVVANDLYEYVVGYDAPTGGLFKKGAINKDFSTFCNEVFKKIGNTWDNDEQILLETYYEASGKMYELYSEIKNKK